MSNTKNEAKISITGSGMSFESIVPIELANKILNLCISPSGKPGITGGVGDEDSIPAQSLSEYKNTLNPKRNPDKILVAAGYLFLARGRANFTPDELPTLFEEMGEPVPANFTRDFKWVKRSGWIAPSSSSSGSYFVTETGKKVLKEGFEGDLVKASRGKANISRVKKARKKKEVI